MLETQRDRPLSRILSRHGLRCDGVGRRYRNICLAERLPNEAIKWELGSKAEHLELSMGWTFNRNSQRSLNIIRALMGSVMARCSHSVNTELLLQERPANLPPGSNHLYKEITQRTLKL
jgi:hypothetical protein